MLICIHHKTYGSENKNKKKLEHIVYKKSPKVTQVYYTANAMIRNKIYTLSILIVPNSFIKNLSEAYTAPAVIVPRLFARFARVVLTGVGDTSRGCRSLALMLEHLI